MKRLSNLSEILAWEGVTFVTVHKYLMVNIELTHYKAF